MCCRSVFRSCACLLLKLFSVVMLFAFCCGISFAADDNFVPINPASYDNAINFNQSMGNNSLTLSNDMFGLHGPFSLQATYSKLFGITFAGTYTQLLDRSNAVLAELDLGGKQRRIAATWGHALTSTQLIKITAENLSQDLDFDFASGKTSKWIYQNAIGGSYAYLLKNGMVNDITVNAYYSKANSKSLSNKNYISGGTTYTNFRRIAGGIDKSASIGLHLLPMPTTLVGVQANYDNVSYSMRNDLTTKNNTRGLGATVSLDQVINDHVKFNLLASHRKPYQDYKAEIDWLVNSAPGSSLELSLLGERIIGNLGTQNDTQGGINLTYTWGGNPTAKPMVYEVPKANVGINGLRDWVSKPAVHMEQVLALKDETSRAAVTGTDDPSKKVAVDDGNKITVYQGKSQQIDVTEYFANKNNCKDAAKMAYAVESLPKGHHLYYKDGKLNTKKNSFTTKDINKSFAIKFVPASVTPSTLGVMNLGLTLTLVVAPNNDHDPNPYPNPHFVNPPITIYATVEKFYNKQPMAYEDQTEDNQFFINPDPNIPGNDLSFSFAGLTELGLQDDVEAKLRSVGINHYFIIGFSGTPKVSDIGEHKINIHASNDQGGISQAPLIITIIIGAKPTITIPSLTFSYKKPVNEDITQYIKSTPGYDLDEVVANLSEYGLSLRFDKKTKKITIIGTPIKTTETERTILISAKNKFGKTDSDFKLDILSPPIKLKDIGDKAAQVGADFPLVSLDDYFEIPAGSSKISDWEIEAKSQDGQVDIKDLGQIKDYFGLKIKDDRLQGVLRDVKQHAPYMFYIKAKNGEGSSIDKDGHPAVVKMNLAVSAENNWKGVGK